MRPLPPGFIRTPTPVAAALISLSVQPLPARSRDRWRDEYRAEIVDLARTRQVREAASALAGCFALRSALHAADSTAIAVTATRWPCRLGRHHYRTVNQDNPENRKYRMKECIHCGKIKEGPDADYPRVDRPFMGGVSPLS
jgi:hypothetical protein